MAPLLTVRSIAKSFGARLIFSDLSLTIDEGERLGLIGPNGAGKSTLLRILAGQTDPDEGEIARRKLLRLAFVEQSPEFEADRTATEVVMAGLDGLPLDGEERTQRTQVSLGRAGFTDLQVRAGTLSGGWKKRLAIARELAREPDLLLLDEPTNHLDLEGIVWLERLLVSSSFGAVIVSHDRYFLDQVASGMAEISTQYPEGIFRVRGDYASFLEKKDEFLAAQAKLEGALAVQVRKEIEWLRRRPKARTTKSKARIDEAGRLKQELGDVSARNTQRGAASIEFSASERRTKRLVVAEHLGKSFGERTLFRDVSFVLGPGTRLGISGRNGSGKSTLLQIVTGKLVPDQGSVELAHNLRLVYFDQNRAQLDPKMTLRRALCSAGDSVIYQDRPVHVISWAKRFLFSVEQLELPVERLSGGEQARVLIAQLMLQPADVLLLDEPTNDLDIPTLEVLEESLLEFPGAIMLVTHDRYLLDRVSTAILGLQGDGGAMLFASYAQWEEAALTRREPVAEAKATAPGGGATVSKKKLSYNESRELEQMEGRIEQAEAGLNTARDRIEDPAIASDGSALQQAVAALEKAEGEVEVLYSRWAELEAKRSR